MCVEAPVVLRIKWSINCQIYTENWNASKIFSKPLKYQILLKSCVILYLMLSYKRMNGGPCHGCWLAQWLYRFVVTCGVIFITKFNHDPTSGSSSWNMWTDGQTKMTIHICIILLSVARKKAKISMMPGSILGERKRYFFPWNHQDSLWGLPSFCPYPT
jgi:hypothetical protein